MSPNTLPEVAEAIEDDRDAIVSTLVLAFADDPFVRWMFETPDGYLATQRRFMQLNAEVALAHGSAYLVRDRAAALWFPPGQTIDPEVLVPTMLEAIPADRHAEKFAVFGQVAEAHPKEPHWYLPAVGVDPPSQGRGCGSALMQRALERVDADHAVSYLESSNARNIPLYQRFGFEVTGEIVATETARLWPMVRPAQ